MMSNAASKVVTLLILLACTPAVPLFAQIENASLGGRVLEDGTDRPIPGALVRVLVNGATVAQAQTDENGVYRVELVRTGPHTETVQAYAPGFVPESHTVQLTCHWIIATPENPTGCAKAVDLYLQREPAPQLGAPRPCQVQGRVIDPGGRPLPGALIELLPSVAARGALADERGSFSLPDLAPGAHVIRVVHIGFHMHEKIVLVHCAADRPSLRVTFQLFPAVVE